VDIPDFRQSRKQLDKTGRRVRKARERGEDPRAEDMKLVDAFRAWHIPTVGSVQVELNRELHHFGPIVGRPLKTTESIIAKMCREKTALSRMQDIAGARITVPDLDAQQRAREATEALFPDIVKTIDRSIDPDRWGYRAIHVVVRVDDRLAEIQLRTVWQDRWAQIVERLDRGNRWDLKHGNGPAEWHEWLHVLADELLKADMGQPYIIPPIPLDQSPPETDEPE
jgi:ppGpp synthetase/RelA/SpoT-type nucleotidyltranferase